LEHPLLLVQLSLIQHFYGCSAVFRRRHFFQIKKAAIKISDVIEADQKADLCNGFIAMRQTLTGLIDPKGVNELDKSMTRGFLEKFGKVSRTHVHMRGNLLQRDARVIVLEDMIQGLI
jgi:hypothetical protein